MWTQTCALPYTGYPKPGNPFTGSFHASPVFKVDCTKATWLWWGQGPSEQLCEPLLLSLCAEPGACLSEPQQEKNPDTGYPMISWGKCDISSFWMLAVCLISLPLSCWPTLTWANYLQDATTWRTLQLAWSQFPLWSPSHQRTKTLCPEGLLTERTTQTGKGHPFRQSLNSPWERELECGLKRKKALLVTSSSSSKNFPWRWSPWSPSYINSALSGSSSSLPLLSHFLFSPPHCP